MKYISMALIGTVLLSGCAKMGTHTSTTSNLSIPPFADNYQGRAEFKGTYQYKTTRYDPSLNTNVNIHAQGLNLNLGNLGNLGKILDIGQTTQDSGEVKFNLAIDGNQVVLEYQPITGSLRGGTIYGMRNGSNCVFRTQNGEWHTICGTTGFNGDFASASGINPSVSINFSSGVTRVISRSEELAERNRLQAEAKAALNAKLSKMTKMQQLLEKALEQDSASWLINRYDIASVTKPIVLEKYITLPDGTRSTSTVQANYTINNGASMTITAALKNGEITCVEMSDFPDNCRAVGHPPSHGIMMKALINGFSGSSDDSNNSNNSKKEFNGGLYQQMIERRKEQNAIDKAYGNQPTYKSYELQ